MAGSRARTRARTRSKGQTKVKSKGKGKEKPKSGELTELRSNRRKWSHNVASWHGKRETRLTEFETKLAAVSLSSSSSTLVATDIDTEELGLSESGSENAERSWLGMVVGFVAINQISMDSVTSVRVCPKSSATHATLSLEVWCMREVVYNAMDLHGELCTERPMLSHDLVGNRRFPLDSRGWLSEIWRSWSRDDSAMKWRLTFFEC